MPPLSVRFTGRIMRVKSCPCHKKDYVKEGRAFWLFYDGGELNSYNDVLMALETLKIIELKIKTYAND